MLLKHNCIKPDNQTCYDKGIPVVSWSGYVTSPYALSASANYNEEDIE